ncbi:MAG: hypothetical protein HN849_14585 [Victivallales bacterium]|nr:hypothetical protein [Victivallales bacterium]
MRTLLCAIAFLFFMASAPAQERIRSVYVVVALCDNDRQGIVPVPRALGNGDDPGSNLYWGALYGTKTFLRKSKDWTLVSTTKDLDKKVLERVIFQHRSKTVYLVADAYRGAWIRDAIIRFMATAAGNDPATVTHDGTAIPTGGNADLVAYIGHNGLMDFTVPEVKQKQPGRGKAAIVLACKSKPYFGARLAKLGCRSLLLTTNFMAPEAYTLEAGLAGWIAGEQAEQIRERAAKAYHAYQKCGMAGARRMFHAE